MASLHFWTFALYRTDKRSCALTSNHTHDIPALESRIGIASSQLHRFELCWIRHLICLLAGFPDLPFFPLQHIKLPLSTWRCSFCFSLLFPQHTRFQFRTCFNTTPLCLRDTHGHCLQEQVTISHDINDCEPPTHGSHNEDPFCTITPLIGPFLPMSSLLQYEFPCIRHIHSQQFRPNSITTKTTHFPRLYPVLRFSAQNRVAVSGSTLAFSCGRHQNEESPVVVMHGIIFGAPNTRLMSTQAQEDLVRPSKLDSPDRGMRGCRRALANGCSFPEIVHTLLRDTTTFRHGHRQETFTCSF